MGGTHTCRDGALSTLSVVLTRCNLQLCCFWERWVLLAPVKLLPQILNQIKGGGEEADTDKAYRLHSDGLGQQMQHLSVLDNHHCLRLLPPALPLWFSFSHVPLPPLPVPFFIAFLPYPKLPIPSAWSLRRVSAPSSTTLICEAGGHSE